MANLGPILMENEAKMLNSPASGGASSGAPSPAGGGGRWGSHSELPRLRASAPLCSPARFRRYFCGISAAPIYDIYYVISFDQIFDLTAGVYFYLYTILIRAIGVSHTACKDELRWNLRSHTHSWSVFVFL